MSGTAVSAAERPCVALGIIDPPFLKTRSGRSDRRTPTWVVASIPLVFPACLTCGRLSRYAVGVLTQADRAAERRRAKLEQIQQQVKDGSLKIRKMTPEERKRY